MDLQVSMDVITHDGIRNSEAYDTFVSLGSDHRIVVANVTLKVRSHQQFPLEISGGNGYRGNF